MVESTGLLNRRRATFLGFESLTLRQRRVEVAPQLVWVSKSHMMRSGVAITTKGSMKVFRQVFVDSVTGPSRIYPVQKTPHTYTTLTTERKQTHTRNEL